MGQGAAAKRQRFAPLPKSDSALAMAAATRRTQTERREEAEARIIEAATKLVAQRGYDAFTLNDVGELSGYSRGLPAHYFGSKEELLLRVVDEIVDDYAARIRPRPAIESGLPKLEEIIRQYCAYSRRPEGKALSIIIGQAGLPGEVSKRICELTQSGLAMLEGELRRAVASGAIPDDADIPAVARIIYAFLRGQLSFCAMDETFDNAPMAEAFIAGLPKLLRGMADHAEEA